MIEREVRIINRRGLHARAAGRLVTLAQKFTSRITLEREGRKANGKSIMGVLTLAATRGSMVTIRAEGPDEAEAIEALVEEIASGFGEAE